MSPGGPNWSADVGSRCRWKSEGPLLTAHQLSPLSSAQRKKQQKVLYRPHGMHAQLFWHNAELNNSGDLKSWPWARAASFSPSCFQRQENVYRQSKLRVVMSSSVPPGGAQPSTHREHTVDVSHQQLVSCWVVGEKNTITSLGANFHRFKNRSSSSAYFVSQCFWQWPFFLPSQRATGHVCCLQIPAMLAACDWMDCTKPTEQCLRSFLRAFIIKQHIGFPSQAVRLWRLQSL